MIPGVDPSPAVRTSALSLRTNFSWTFLGNVVYAASSWGMLVVLAKLGDPVMVGQFALGLAVTAPVIMLANLQLRAVQATDARQDYRFGDYLGLRLLMTALALLVIGIIVVVAPYGAETKWVVGVIGLGKGCDAISDIYWGFFQQRERMDYIARSMVLNGVCSLIALALAVALTGRVVWGAVGWALVSAGTLLAYTIPVAVAFARPGEMRPRFERARLLPLGRMVLPLGVVMMLISLNTNIPRYVIEDVLGERELGIFAAMAYLMVAGTTVVSALGQSATPRLARYYNEGSGPAFRDLLVKLLGIGAALGLAGIVVVGLTGRSILTILYTPEYGEQAAAFTWVMVATGVGFVSSFLGYGMTAARYFRAQAPLFALVTGVTALASTGLIPRHGLPGAAAALVIAAAIQFVGSVVINLFALHRLFQREERPA